MREDKRGYIDNINLSLLERLNISPENWLKLITRFTRIFHTAVGRPTSQCSGQLKDQNRYGEWRQKEKEWGKELDRGKSVEVEILVQYDGDNTTPKVIFGEYIVAGKPAPFRFKN